MTCGSRCQYPWYRILQVSEGGPGRPVLPSDGVGAFLDCPPATEIWWGAYLGTPDELLLAGTVADVGERIAAVRAEARNRHGWIMDIYLLRS